MNAESGSASNAFRAHGGRRGCALSPGEAQDARQRAAELGCHPSRPRFRPCPPPPRWRRRYRATRHGSARIGPLRSRQAGSPSPAPWSAARSEPSRSRNGRPRILAAMPSTLVIQSGCGGVRKRATSLTARQPLSSSLRSAPRVASRSGSRRRMHLPQSRMRWPEWRHGSAVTAAGSSGAAASDLRYRPPERGGKMSSRRQTGEA